LENYVLKMCVGGNWLKVVFIKRFSYNTESVNQT